MIGAGGELGIRARRILQGTLLRDQHEGVQGAIELRDPVQRVPRQGGGGEAAVAQLRPGFGDGEVFQLRVAHGVCSRVMVSRT